MSAEIIQFIPRPNPNREKQLEARAIEIANAAFPSVFAFDGSGIDGMQFPYVTPSQSSPGKDSA